MRKATRSGRLALRARYIRAEDWCAIARRTQTAVRFRMAGIVKLLEPLATVTGRAKTGQRGALKTGQCFDDAYTSSLRFRATFS
jgi:hypothetical protein